MDMQIEHGDAGGRLKAVLIYGINPDWSEAERIEAERESRRLGYAIRRQGRSLALSAVRSSDIAGVLDEYDPYKTLVLNWCEELPGETHSEMRVAEILEEKNFTFTGASSSALDLCYDKPRIKAMLRDSGVPTPDWAVFENTRTEQWACFPAIVKPSREHCSMGMDSRSVVVDPASLSEQVARILDEFHQPVLVEDFVDGREFHVSVWGNGKLEMLPPVEMDFSALTDVHDRVCSYAAKFAPDSDAYRMIKTVVPARLDKVEMQELDAVCKTAYRVGGCRDYGRIDVRMRDGVFYVLDVNPNADISADASMAVAAEKKGLCYGALGARLIELAAARHPVNCS